jgi:integrase
MGKRTGVSPGSGTSINIDFPYKGQRCRERIKLAPTKRNLNYVANLRARILHEIATNQFDYAKHFPESPRAAKLAMLPGGEILIEPFLKAWLDIVRSNVAHATHLGYRKIINAHLIPSFGKLKLAEFKLLHWLEWMDQHTTLSAKRVRNIASVLRTALDHAKERERMAINPLAQFEVKRKDRKTDQDAEDIDPFSIEERTAILAALRQEQDRNFVDFAFWTGLRTSEQIAANWTDVDWFNKVIRIRHVLTQGMECRERRTKTNAGFREVALLQPALDALQRQKALTFLKGQEIFQNPRTGQRWTGDKCIREGMWGPALRKARVRYRKPYQTRHTFASSALMAGEDKMWVANQMGHTNWAFTAKTYARFIPANDKTAGNRLVAAYKNPVSVVNISST